MRHTKQELFARQRYQYGCGYWSSCWEHACPCRISIADKGVYDEEIDKALKDEAHKAANDFYGMLYREDDSEELYKLDVFDEAARKYWCRSKNNTKKEN